MKIAELWSYTKKPGLLGRLSGGSGRRAAIVLAGVNLALPLVLVVIWFVGLAPIFDDWHWVPAVIASAVYLVGAAWLMGAFGFWGVGASSGQDGGDQFGKDFSIVTAFGLGWLRWLVQIVAIGGGLLLVILIWMDLRWWHLFSAPELDALPRQAAAIPIPKDWQLHESDDNADDPPMGKPQRTLRRMYDVPNGYTFDDMRKWVRSTQWAPFGSLTDVDCMREGGDCTADATPKTAASGEYHVQALYYKSHLDGVPPTVTVYFSYFAPGADK